MLADVKTAEALDLHASAVLSAMTVQSSTHADAVEWVSDAWLDAQLDRLLMDPPFSDRGPDALKLGLLRDAQQGHRVLDKVQSRWPNVHVVWDPVLSASAGLDFHEAQSTASGEAFPGWSQLAERCSAWTPNLPEWLRLNAPLPGLLGRANMLEVASQWSIQHPDSLLWLKGGHDEQSPGVDRLFKGQQAWHLMPDQNLSKRVCAKHGSGCVLASALAALLAKGLPLKEACQRAKRYGEAYLASSTTLHGQHGAAAQHANAAVSAPNSGLNAFSTVQSNT